MTSLRELKQLYEQGQNICEYLRRELNVSTNTPEIIEIAYDLQTGSYTRAMSDPVIIKHKTAYTATIAGQILKHCPTLSSVMEAGVGEATTLSGVISLLRMEAGHESLQGYGFDLSWSRLSYARRWLTENNIDQVDLCCGDLLNIPFCDNSIDVVYTSHSVEPNGGNEEPILRELYRVARKYVILCEPGYELGDDVAKARMDHHGYCKNLPGISRELGYDVVDHHLIDCSAIPQNPSAITVIRKPQADSGVSDSVFACPKTRTPLVAGEGVLYSPESLTAYPIVGGIPCLRSENGILASRYEEVAK
ncbi:Methyltransferase domain protein [Rubripirellula amarantea]|uniref:Methyltransferase domain protein n=1 Tax=Rubripirellula amarantea TaxID=2527999 RepID=A0A5C5WUP2_9BACT|nr:methyltransferase domain-containing protein [Rubripirellula amarantea]TWT53723.1 Methyltransferase domain protein [Rubripirellula amarantea]